MTAPSAIIVEQLQRLGAFRTQYAATLHDVAAIQRQKKIPQKFTETEFYPG
jgi:hypothetical protein